MMRSGRVKNAEVLDEIAKKTEDRSDDFQRSRRRPRRTGTNSEEEKRLRIMGGSRGHSPVSCVSFSAFSGRRYMIRPPEVTSRIMRSIKGKDSKAERLFRREFHAKGARYRKHYSIPGTPDLVVVWARLAIFIDGDFWHGNSWKKRGLPNLEAQFPNRTHYWVTKIERNMKRDRRVNRLLRADGWTVIRFWESDVLADVTRCVRKALNALGRSSSRS